MATPENPYNSDDDVWANPKPLRAKLHIPLEPTDEVIGCNKPDHFARSVAHQKNHLRVAKKIQSINHGE
jgi:hypothetical protein